MKQITLCCGLLMSIGLLAQAPVFYPGLPVSAIGIVDSPIGEEAINTIDGDDQTKFLDFALDDGFGILVDLMGIPSNVESFEITTANDFPERDPMNWEVEGSNNGADFTTVASGEIECLDERFNTRLYPFNISEEYVFYRITLTNACDPTGGDGIPSMQIAELQLYSPIIGIQDVPLTKSVSISPNPAVNEIALNVTNGYTVVAIEVYDVMGKIVSVRSEDDRVDVSNLTSGIYMIKVSTEAGAVVRKFVKQ